MAAEGQQTTKTEEVYKIWLLYRDNIKSINHDRGAESKKVQENETYFFGKGKAESDSGESSSDWRVRTVSGLLHLHELMMCSSHCYKNQLKTSVHVVCTSHVKGDLVRGDEE